MNIEINQFRKGIFDICKLFKTIFQNDRNIIVSKNNINYINNLDQLFSLKTANDSSYNFATNYMLTQIQNFRENICINPILYIIAFEQLIEKITSFRELEKYDFSKIVNFLKWYYENSNLPKAVITYQHIKNLFIKESEDKFLSEVINQSAIPQNIEIVESKHNNLIKHKYYKLKCHYISGKIYGNNHKLFMTTNLTKELLAKLISLKIPILLIYCDADFYPGDNYNVTTMQLSVTNYLKNYNNICLLTGFGRGYQNLNIEELNNYSFGDIKEFKFVNGELLFSSEIYYTKKQVDNMKIEDKYSYYALQGKNLTIEVNEEYLERVKSIVSIVKALQNNGIFYTEPKSLRIISKSLIDNEDLKKYIDNLLKNYLQLFRFNINTIQEVIDNGDLSASFNVYTGKYEGEIFTSLDYYLNIFSLLDSNVKTLSKLN